jgi:bifunctional non-homologous end joining protein LigD
MKVEITNPNKILFPKSKITKEEFVDYYKFIAKKMLPLIKDRPISMQRFPGGINGIVFFQKNVFEYFPSWIKTVSVKRKNKENIKMALCNDRDSLLYLANQVCVPHVWLSRKDKLDYPDRMIFDLDPPKDDFPSVVKASLDLKKMLDELKLPSFVMTTGSKGLHVVIPIKREKKFDEVRHFARKIAENLAS